MSGLFPPGVFVSDLWVEPGPLDHLDPLYPEEASRVERAVAKRVREFRAGRHAARRALALAGGQPAAVRAGAAGEPLFPEGFSGSITHTGWERTYAAAAVTELPLWLGLDAEEKRELAGDILDRVVTSEEQRRLASVLPPADFGVVAFSVKEAIYKCVFPRVGKMFGFFEVELLEASYGARGGDQGSGSVSAQVHVLDGQPLLEARFELRADVVVSAAQLPR